MNQLPEPSNASPPGSTWPLPKSFQGWFWQKLLAQCAAAGWVWWIGVRVAGVGLFATSTTLVAALLDAGRELGFHEVEMRVAGRSFSEQVEQANGHGTWDLLVPLGPEDYIHLTREFENGIQNSVVIPFVETLRARFRTKEFPRARAAAASALQIHH